MSWVIWSWNQLAKENSYGGRPFHRAKKRAKKRFPPSDFLAQVRASCICDKRNIQNRLATHPTPPTATPHTAPSSSSSLQATMPKFKDEHDTGVTPPLPPSHTPGRRTTSYTCYIFVFIIFPRVSVWRPLFLLARPARRDCHGPLTRRACHPQ